MCVTDFLPIMTRVYICATLALAQAAIAASNHQASNVLQGDDAVASQVEEALPDVPPPDECLDCARRDDDGESSDDDIKDAIQDAFEDVFERYVDEEAVEQWADETASAFREMQQRQQQETAEWAEGVAK